MAELPSYETLLITREDGVTTLTLNRPDKRNAMNPSLHMEMHDALSHLWNDTTMRVLIVDGAGPCFSAGNDLKETVLGLAHDESERVRIARLWHDWCDRLLRNVLCPTVAKVHGYCFGAALSVVCNCDFALAAEDTMFGLPEVTLGNMPGGLIPKMLMGLVPYRDVMAMAMTGEPFDARRAELFRLINRAVPANQLDAETAALARHLASLDPHALRATKEALHQIGDMNDSQAYFWLQAKGNELRWRPDRIEQAGEEIERFLKKESRPGLNAPPEPGRT